MATKTVAEVDYDKPGKILATYELVGDKLVSSYFNKVFETDMEEDGIFVSGRTLRPADGKDFYDLLELGLSNSSTITVRES